MVRRLVVVIAAAIATAYIFVVSEVVRSPRLEGNAPEIINDVSQLNPVTVQKTIAPTTTAEIIAAIKQHYGSISIGGARHSMGGQIASEGSLHIDMRHFDRIVALSPEEKEVTVQGGTRWRSIQERIDPINLSIQIMQSYSNFTVGGSLSVNAHGRYLRRGPIIASVKSIQVVLADGSLIEADRQRNRDIFDGVIGGYGGLGVITEATLKLADNVKLKRHAETMPAAKYKEYFFSHIREAPDTVFHNADIYPPKYDTVHAVTFSNTDDPVEIADRLIPIGKSYWQERFGYWLIARWRWGSWLRQHVLDPIHYRNESVVWRNYEASYDALELEPASRRVSTYALQEYFVPVERFDDFVARMRNILERHKPSIVNVSVRHANQDQESLLTWARTEVFAFVIYYSQGTNPNAQDRVGEWARELIDAALALGGSYYLPYQLHATEEQFLKAYPRADKFFQLKQRIDPTNKFRNQLWNKYYHPSSRKPATVGGSFFDPTNTFVDFACHFVRNGTKLDAATFAWAVRDYPQPL
jgi:FAD/FMN-containing dehydrogenase